MNAFLPRQKVYIPELEVTAVVVAVFLSTSGTEYKCRYFKDQVPYETYFFDFEVSSGRETANA